MRERSYYRGKKKGKKKEQIGKGTQGATGGASSELCVQGSAPFLPLQLPLGYLPLIQLLCLSQGRQQDSQ